MPVAEATTIYGNANYETSFAGDADSWEGKFGIKMT